MKQNINQNPVAVFIVPGAMVAGVMLFLGVTLFLASTSQATPPEEPDTSLYKVMSQAHVFFALAAIFLSHFFYTRMISRIGAPNLQKFISALIIKFALLEGAALFGLVIVLMVVFAGIHKVTGVYFWNYLSSAYMLFEFLRFVPIFKTVYGELRHSPDNSFSAN